jgi:quercetin dioxygenase-like cupin family protein
MLEIMKVAVFLLLPLALAAQTSASEVKIDTPRVRVLAATEQPHQPTALHQHQFNRVMIYLDSGRMTETRPSGERQTIDFKAGDVRWSPAAGPHTSEFFADHPVRLIEIEVKSMPASEPVLSPLDPLKVDPEHYSLVFENPQVRVLRVRFGAGESSARHEHSLDHIVVYLTDQARGKAGEVRLDGPMIHTEQNPLPRPVERIAVDLK